MFHTPANAESCQAYMSVSVCMALFNRGRKGQTDRVERSRNIPEHFIKRPMTSPHSLEEDGVKSNPIFPSMGVMCLCWWKSKEEEENLFTSKMK